MSLEHPLDPRGVLPYSDTEIRELYREAKLAGPEPRSPEEEARLRVSRSRLAAIEVSAFAVLAYAFVFVALLGPVEAYVALLWGALAFMMVGAGLAQLATRGPVGPWTRRLYRRFVAEIRSEFEAVDPYDLEVLRTVVRHVAGGPLRREEELVGSIEASRHRLEGSLAELPALAQDLAQEAAATEDESVRMLIEARHASALATVERLLALDQDLARQKDEAEAAVEPIRQVVDKFERIGRIAESLTRIQAAHGLISDSQESIEEHRLQLALLRAATASASARLGDIQRVVESHERAVEEVAALSAGA